MYSVKVVCYENCTKSNFVKIWWVEGKMNTHFVQLLEFQFKETVGQG